MTASTVGGSALAAQIDGTRSGIEPRQSGIGGGVDAYRWHIKRGSKVAQAGIHPDHGARLAQQRGRFVETQARCADRIGNGRTQTFGTRLFLFIAPGQHRTQAGAMQLFAQCDPVRLVPQFVVAAGGMQQHDIRFVRQPGQRGIWYVDAIIRRACNGVTKRGGGELAVALYRVQIFGNGKSAVVKPAGQRFARAIPGMTAAVSVGAMCDECALQQALRIQREIIMPDAQLAANGLHFPARSPPGFAPAPHGDRDDLVHAGMQCRQRRKVLLHHPVDARSRQVFANIRHDREVVQHIAQRGRFDENDVWRV